ncbi:MAG: threonylcarbamoyl-AMP synthase [Atopostipes sp.]|nr:threonylcarbamoyl-AMP synthase [Atopostipes sp.]
METKKFSNKDLAEAAALIQEGEVVAFPTDTVYGLGADARNEEAVQKIFTAKKRPANRALSILLADPLEMNHYVEEIPEAAQLLVQEFWPGPLTIVLKSKDLLADAVNPGLDTVGMRMPNHSLALEFIQKCGFPLATPSANLSGRPSPSSADHVLADLDGRIAGVIDGGESDLGIESTVLDLSNPEKPVILRPGGIRKSQIEQVIARKVEKKETNYEENKHYEPETPLYLVESSWPEAMEKMTDEKIAILASEETSRKYAEQAIKTYSLGDKEDINQANKLFFKGLRALEHSEASVILAESYPASEKNHAYMNRLEKAAQNKRI